MSIMGVERDEDGLTYEEQRKETERWYRSLQAENARLRAALADMIEYANFNEAWQNDHPEYVRNARAALGQVV